MKYFVGYIKKTCFIGSKKCNQGGFNPPSEEVINGVVNNGVLVSHMGIIIVNTGN